MTEHVNAVNESAGVLRASRGSTCSGLSEGFLDEAVEMEREVTLGSVRGIGVMDMAAQDDVWVSDQNACKSKALLPDRAVGRGVGFAGGTAENKASGEDRWRHWKCYEVGRQADGGGTGGNGGEGTRR